MAHLTVDLTASKALGLRGAEPAEEAMAAAGCTSPNGDAYEIRALSDSVCKHGSCSGHGRGLMTVFPGETLFARAVRTYVISIRPSR